MTNFKEKLDDMVGYARCFGVEIVPMFIEALELAIEQYEEFIKAIENKTYYGDNVCPLCCVDSLMDEIPEWNWDFDKKGCVCPWQIFTDSHCNAKVNRVDWARREFDPIDSDDLEYISIALYRSNRRIIQIKEWIKLLKQYEKEDI